MRRRQKRLLPLVLVPALLLTWFGLEVWQRSTFITPRPTAIMTDRQGVFMAQLGGGPRGYGYWPVAEVPDRVAAAILALEDKRFWRHPGIDPIAVLRAVRLDYVAGRRVSGASTLAMQVARMQHPEARTLGAKIMEAATALVMTARYGRLGVLRQYLLLVPFGQNSHGIADAAIWYFNRPVQDLSWAQIAFLSAIPQAPGLYNPSNPAGLQRVKARAGLALSRLRQQKILDAPSYAEAQADLAQLTPIPHPKRQDDALHAILHVQAMLQNSSPIRQVHSTLDLGVQRLVRKIVQRRLADLAPEGARQAAVIVADRASMGVLALVGSGAYGAANDGEINYAMRWRSPGSTMKPFIFAQALDSGTIAPDSILFDAPGNGTDIQNADLRFLGPLLAAQALANSRNVPAAELVRLDGLDQSAWFLATMGLNDDFVPPQRYGLTLAIGGMPTELDRLVVAYGALANAGVLKPLRWYEAQPEPADRRVMSVNTARLVSVFLSDPMARLPSFGRMGSTEFPFPVAVKTGTSQGYRDAWVMEFTDKYVVGVWVGRPDGRPMDALGGGTSAALIGQDILKDLYQTEMDGQNDADFLAPPGGRPVEVCATTGLLAGSNCAEQMVTFPQPGAASPLQPPSTDTAMRITEPLSHSVYIMNPDAPPGLAVLELRVAAGPRLAQTEWIVDGKPFQIADAHAPVFWSVMPGWHSFEAIDPFSQKHTQPVEVLVR
jgi:penicillin-binding protein 1C